MSKAVPEADATPDEAFELGQISGYDKGYADALGEFSVPNSSPETSHLIALERARQIAKGYTAQHDSRHGVVKLLEWSTRFANHGQHIEAAAMVEAARALIAFDTRGTVHRDNSWVTFRDYSGAAGQENMLGVAFDAGWSAAIAWLHAQTWQPRNVRDESNA